MGLNSEQIQRAHGMMLAKAAGDALGAGYEFGDPLPESTAIDMIGGGPFGFDPYEWTDDTSMSITVAQALLQSPARRLDETACDAAVAGWSDWSRDAKDVGAQTSNVLSTARASAATGSGIPTARDARNAAADLHRRSGRSGGNGSLMRTAPLALAYLDRPENELLDAAFSLSALTHFDPEAGEACALWCLALRHAILTGELDVRIGLPLLTPEQAAGMERTHRDGRGKHPCRLHEQRLGHRSFPGRMVRHRHHQDNGSIGPRTPQAGARNGRTRRAGHRHRCGNRRRTSRGRTRTGRNPRGLAGQAPRLAGLQRR